MHKKWQVCLLMILITSLLFGCKNNNSNENKTSNLFQQQFTDQNAEEENQSSKENINEDTVFDVLSLYETTEQEMKVYLSDHSIPYKEYWTDGWNEHYFLNTLLTDKFLGYDCYYSFSLGTPKEYYGDDEVTIIATDKTREDYIFRELLGEDIKQTLNGIPYSWSRDQREAEKYINEAQCLIVVRDSEEYKKALNDLLLFFNMNKMEELEIISDETSQGRTTIFPMDSLSVGEEEILIVVMVENVYCADREEFANNGMSMDGYINNGIMVSVSVCFMESYQKMLEMEQPFNTSISAVPVIVDDNSVDRPVEIE